MFFVSEDWYFCSHRLPIARAAYAAGYEVHVVTQMGRSEDQLRTLPFVVHPVRLKRAGLNPISECILLRDFVRILHEVRPDILHNVAMKPVIYGSVAAMTLPGTRVVNALAGLGFIYSSATTRARLLRHILRYLLPLLLKGRRTRTIVQNADDRSLLSAVFGIDASNIVLVPGSGVDPDLYVPSEHETRMPVVALPARLLRDKGVHEFVAAASLLRATNVAARFVLLGEPDPENPSSVSSTELLAWQSSGAVEVWGWSNDMASALARVDVVVLPSYREGLPKSLLEAASSGLPIVTTDVPGCKDVVVHGESGFLVPARNVEQLASAIHTLVSDEKLRERMGQVGRKRVQEHFSEAAIVEQTLRVYRDLQERTCG